MNRPSTIASRLAGGALACVYFWTQCAFSHAQESGFWRERRDASRRAVREAPAGSSPFQTLAQLPQAAPLDFVGPRAVSAGFPALSALPGDALAAENRSAAQADPAAWISMLSPHGSLRELHLSPVPAAPFIIHVQDAHEVEEAQRNMAVLLQTLRARRGVSLIGLEGASGPFALDAYRAYPGADVTRGLAEHFLKEGVIGGPEFLGLTAPESPLLWGLEDPAAYARNVEALKASGTSKPALEERLSRALSALEREKARAYTPALREFDRRSAAYRERSEGLGRYVRYLAGISAPGEGAFPNLRMLLDALTREERLDFNRVEAERRRLLERLAGTLPPERLDLLLRKSMEYRRGRITYGGYYRFVRDLCGQAGLRLRDFGSLDDYIRYVLLSEGIDRAALLGELDRLERRTEEALAATPERRRLAADSRRLTLLKKLSEHAMTPEDWSAYGRERGELARLLGGERPEDLLAPFESFCSGALDRNRALLENLLAKMRTEKVPAAVLVAGGFHTDGLARLMRERRVSYAVVAPRITEVPKENRSLDVFTRDGRPLEKLFSGEVISLKYAPPLAVGAGTRESRFTAALFAAAHAAFDASLPPDGRPALSAEGLDRLAARLPHRVALKDAVRREGAFLVHGFEASVDGRAFSFEAVVTTKEKLAVALNRLGRRDGLGAVEVAVKGTPYVMAVFKTHPLGGGLRAELREALKAASLWGLVWEEALAHPGLVSFFKAHPDEGPKAALQRTAGIAGMLAAFSLPLLPASWLLSTFPLSWAASALLLMAVFPFSWLAMRPGHWAYDRLALRFGWAPLMTEKGGEGARRPRLEDLEDGVPLPPEYKPVYHESGEPEALAALDRLADRAKEEGRPFVLLVPLRGSFPVLDVMKLYVNEYAPLKGLKLPQAHIIRALGDAEFKDWLMTTKGYLPEIKRIREETIRQFSSGRYEGLPEYMRDWIRRRAGLGSPVEVSVLAGNASVEEAWEKLQEDAIRYVFGMTAHVPRLFEGGPEERYLGMVANSLASSTRLLTFLEGRMVRERLRELARDPRDPVVVPFLHIDRAGLDSSEELELMSSRGGSFMFPFARVFSSRFEQSKWDIPFSQEELASLYEMPLYIALLANLIEKEGLMQAEASRNVYAHMASMEPVERKKLVRMMAEIRKKESKTAIHSNKAGIAVIDQLRRKKLWPPRLLPKAPEEPAPERGVEGFLGRHGIPPPSPALMEEHAAPRTEGGETLALPADLVPVFAHRDAGSRLDLLAEQALREGKELIIVGEMKQVGLGLESVFKEYFGGYLPFIGQASEGKTMLDILHDEKFREWLRERHEAKIHSIGDGWKDLGAGEWEGLAHPAFFQDWVKRNKDRVPVRVAGVRHASFDQLWRVWSVGGASTIADRRLDVPGFWRGGRDGEAFKGLARFMVEQYRGSIRTVARAIGEQVLEIRRANPDALVVPVFDAWLAELEPPDPGCDLLADGNLLLSPLDRAVLQSESGRDLPDAALDEVYFFPIFQGLLAQTDGRMTERERYIQVNRVMKILSREDKFALIDRMAERRREERKKGKNMSDVHYSVVDAVRRKTAARLTPFGPLSPSGTRGLKAYLASTLPAKAQPPTAAEPAAHAPAQPMEEGRGAPSGEALPLLPRDLVPVFTDQDASPRLDLLAEQALREGKELIIVGELQELGLDSGLTTKEYFEDYLPSIGKSTEDKSVLDLVRDEGFKEWSRARLESEVLSVGGSAWKEMKEGEWGELGNASFFRDWVERNKGRIPIRVTGVRNVSFDHAWRSFVLSAVFNVVCHRIYIPAFGQGGPTGTSFTRFSRFLVDLHREHLAASCRSVAGSLLEIRRANPDAMVVPVFELGMAGLDFSEAVRKLPSEGRPLLDPIERAVLGTEPGRDLPVELVEELFFYPIFEGIMRGIPEGLSARERHIRANRIRDGLSRQQRLGLVRGMIQRRRSQKKMGFTEDHFSLAASLGAKAAALHSPAAPPSPAEARGLDAFLALLLPPQEAPAPSEQQPEQEHSPEEDQPAPPAPEASPSKGVEPPRSPPGKESPAAPKPPVEPEVEIVEEEPVVLKPWAEPGFKVLLGDSGPSVDMDARTLTLDAEKVPEGWRRRLAEDPDQRHLNALARRGGHAAEGVRSYLWERLARSMPEGAEIRSGDKEKVLARMEKEMEALLDGRLLPEEVWRVVTGGEDEAWKYLEEKLSGGLSTWSQLLMVLEEYPGLVNHLLVDLDDTLFTPWGYLGSESAFRDGVALKRNVKPSALRAQKRHEEKWLLRHGAFREMEKNLAERLAALGKGGLEITALTERGPRDREATEAVLERLGFRVRARYAGNRRNKLSFLKRVRDRGTGGFGVFVDDRIRGTLGGIDPASFHDRGILAMGYAGMRGRAYDWAEAESRFTRFKKEGRTGAAAVWAAEALIRLKAEADIPEVRWLFYQDVLAFMEESRRAMDAEDRDRLTMAWVESAADFLAGGMDARLEPSEARELRAAFFGFLAPHNAEMFVDGSVRVARFAPPGGEQRSMESDYEVELNEENAYAFLEPLIRAILSDPPEVILLPETGASPFAPLLKSVIEEEGLSTRIVSFPVSQHGASDTPYELRRWMRLLSGKEDAASLTPEDRALAASMDRVSLSAMKDARVFVFDDNLDSGKNFLQLKRALDEAFHPREVAAFTPFAYKDPAAYPFPVVATFSLPGTAHGWSSTAEVRGPPFVVRTKWEFKYDLRGAVPRLRYQSPPARRPAAGPEAADFARRLLERFKADRDADREASKVRRTPEASRAPAVPAAAAPSPVFSPSGLGTNPLPLAGGWSLRPGRGPDPRAVAEQRLFSPWDAEGPRPGVEFYDVLSPEGKAAGFILLVPAREEDGGVVFILRKVQPLSDWDGVFPAKEVVAGLKEFLQGIGAGLLMPSEPRSIEGLSESHRVRRLLLKEHGERRRFEGELVLPRELEDWVGSLNVITKSLSEAERARLQEGESLVKVLLLPIRGLGLENGERARWRRIRKALQAGDPPGEGDLIFLRALADRVRSGTHPGGMEEADEEEREEGEEVPVSPKDGDEDAPRGPPRDPDADWRAYLDLFGPLHRSRDLGAGLNPREFADYGLLQDYQGRFGGSLLKLLNHITGEEGVYVLEGTDYAVDADKPVSRERLRRFLAGEWWAAAPGTRYAVVGDEKDVPAGWPRTWFRNRAGYAVTFVDDANHGLAGRVTDRDGETVDWIFIETDPASGKARSGLLGNRSLGLLDIVRWRQGKGGDLRPRAGGSAAELRIPPNGRLTVLDVVECYVPLGARSGSPAEGWTVRLHLAGNLAWPQGGQLVMDDVSGGTPRRLNAQHLTKDGKLRTGRTSAARDTPAAYNALMRALRKTEPADAPAGTYAAPLAARASGDLYLGRADVQDELVNGGLVPAGRHYRIVRDGAGAEKLEPIRLFGVEAVQDPARGSGLDVWEDKDGTPDRSRLFVSYRREEAGKTLALVDVRPPAPPPSEAADPALAAWAARLDPAWGVPDGLEALSGRVVLSFPGNAGRPRCTLEVPLDSEVFRSPESLPARPGGAERGNGGTPAPLSMLGGLLAMGAAPSPDWAGLAWTALAFISAVVPVFFALSWRRHYRRGAPQADGTLLLFDGRAALRAAAASWLGPLLRLLSSAPPAARDRRREALERLSALAPSVTEGPAALSRAFSVEDLDAARALHRREAAAEGRRRTMDVFFGRPAGPVRLVPVPRDPRDFDAAVRRLERFHGGREGLLRLLAGNAGSLLSRIEAQSSRRGGPDGGLIENLHAQLAMLHMLDDGSAGADLAEAALDLMLAEAPRRLAAALRNGKAPEGAPAALEAAGLASFHGMESAAFGLEDAVERLRAELSLSRAVAVELPLAGALNPAAPLTGAEATAYALLAEFARSSGEGGSLALPIHDPAGALRKRGLGDDAVLKRLLARGLSSGLLPKPVFDALAGMPRERLSARVADPSSGLLSAGRIDQDRLRDALSAADLTAFGLSPDHWQGLILLLLAGRQLLDLEKETSAQARRMLRLLTAA